MCECDSEVEDPTYHPESTDDECDEEELYPEDCESVMFDDLMFFVSERNNLTPIQKQMYLSLLYALIQEQENE